MRPQRLVSLVQWIIAAGCLVGSLNGCGSQTRPPSEGSMPVAPTPTPGVTAISISGSIPEIGATTQLTATAVRSDGSAQDVTAQATWDSSNVAVISMSEGGAARGVGAGEADITASFGGSTGSRQVRLEVRTFGLDGVIADQATGRPIAGSDVEILDGKNAGKRSSRSDSNGYYSLSGLLADTFGIRARASGYEFSDRAVTIADSDARADVTLRAAARPGPAPGCAFTVTPASLSFSKGGVSDTFGSRISVGAAQGCAWTATADAGWVLLSDNGVRDVQAVSGSGPASVVVSVNANMSLLQSARVRIRWATGSTDVVVSQAGARTCVAGLAPDRQDFGAGGGSGTIVVTAPADCTWKATAYAPFITIAGVATGTANRTVSYNVAPNASAVARSGDIGFSEPGGATVRKTFSVSQAGKP
jgi:hypothetical protein